MPYNTQPGSTPAIPPEDKPITPQISGEKRKYRPVSDIHNSSAPCWIFNDEWKIETNLDRTEPNSYFLVYNDIFAAKFSLIIKSVNECKQLSEVIEILENTDSYSPTEKCIFQSFAQFLQTNSDKDVNLTVLQAKLNLVPLSMPSYSSKVRFMPVQQEQEQPIVHPEVARINVNISILLDSKNPSKGMRVLDIKWGYQDTPNTYYTFNVPFYLAHSQVSLKTYLVQILTKNTSSLDQQNNSFCQAFLKNTNSKVHEILHMTLHTLNQQSSYLLKDLVLDLPLSASSSLTC